MARWVKKKITQPPEENGGCTERFTHSISPEEKATNSQLAQSASWGDKVTQKRNIQRQQKEKPRYLTSGEKTGQKGPTPEKCSLFNCKKGGRQSPPFDILLSSLFQRSYKTERPRPGVFIYGVFSGESSFHKNSPSKLINKETHKGVYDKQIYNSGWYRSLSAYGSMLK